MIVKEVFNCPPNTRRFIVTKVPIGRDGRDAICANREIPGINFPWRDEPGALPVTCKTARRMPTGGYIVNVYNEASAPEMKPDKAGLTKMDYRTDATDGSFQ